MIRNFTRSLSSRSNPLEMHVMQPSTDCRTAVYLLLRWLGANIRNNEDRDFLHNGAFVFDFELCALTTSFGLPAGRLCCSDDCPLLCGRVAPQLRLVIR